MMKTPSGAATALDEMNYAWQGIVIDIDIDSFSTGL
jgi:hypothetical protein